MMNISNETATSPTNETCNITYISRNFNSAPYYDVLQVINFLFGLPTHSYILWLIVTGTGRGIASEFFTLNISICEIMSCMRSLITVLANVFPSLWYIRMFLSGFITTARFFQCLMCVECYLAVVHPVTFLKFKHLRYKVACSILTWIMIIIFNVFILALVHPCNIRLFKCMFLVHFIVLPTINLFCCLAVLRALKKPGPGEKGRQRVEGNHTKRRAFLIILITTVTLVITYLPNTITSLQFILSIPASHELDLLSLTCFFLPGFMQPLLFIHRVGKLPFCRSP